MSESAIPLFEALEGRQMLSASIVESSGAAPLQAQFAPAATIARPRARAALAAVVDAKQGRS